MADIYIDPSDFQKKIDSAKTSNKSIADVKYNNDKKDLMLDSIDQYMACIDDFNKLIKDFTSMCEKDFYSLEVVKANWMDIDESLAEKTFIDYAFGK